MEECDFKEALISEAKLRRMDFTRCDFCRADFFGTPLKGVDLSACEISGIMVSEGHKELKGLKINPAQALDIAAAVGVKIQGAG